MVSLFQGTGYGRQTFRDIHLTYVHGVTPEKFPSRRLLSFHAKCSLRRYPMQDDWLMTILQLQSKGTGAFSEGAIDPLGDSEFADMIRELGMMGDPEDEIVEVVGGGAQRAEEVRQEVAEEKQSLPYVLISGSAKVWCPVCEVESLPRLWEQHLQGNFHQQHAKR
jgi:hypothetical protein